MTRSGGSDVIVKLVDDKQSGKITGKTELTLDLVSVTVNGRVSAVSLLSRFNDGLDCRHRRPAALGNGACRENPRCHLCP